MFLFNGLYWPELWDYWLGVYINADGLLDSVLSLGEAGGENIDFIPTSDRILRVWILLTTFVEVVYIA